MKRIWPVLIALLLCFLAVFIGWLVPTLLAPPAVPQTGYIPPAPPSAAPAIISRTPPPSVTLPRPTWTPTPSSTFIPTATVTASYTPTARSASPTPTLGPDQDTRGSTPTNSPTTGGNPMTPDLLSALAGILLSLGLSYLPGVRERYEALTPDLKRAWAALGIVGIGAGVAALSCAQLADWIICDRPGLMGLASNIVWALIANQSVFLLSPKRSALIASRENGDG